MEIKNKYTRRKKKYNKLVTKQTKKISLLGNVRLLIFIIGATLTAWFYLNKSYYMSMSFAIVFVILFLIAIVIHGKNIELKKYYSALEQVNDMSQQRLLGAWTKFIDTGDIFINNEHNYTSDLDIFGKNSLFQWINTSSTCSGRQHLKELLCPATINSDDISLRQEAIKELAKKLSFRQRFIAEAIVHQADGQCLNSLYIWGKTKNKFYDKLWFKVFVRTFPIVTVLITILPFVNTSVPLSAPLIMFLINSLILFPNSAEKTKVLKEVFQYKKSLVTYSKMFKCIEKTKFNSTYLRKLAFKDSSNHLDKLTNITEMISLRSSSIYMILNLLFLWDYQCLIALEKWKSLCGDQLEAWINGVGEIEALSSLALIHFDNPNWEFPSISKKNKVIKAEELGHHLLSAKRVCNPITLTENSNILLITGSNMSGKSTFLRTIGINLVLAYAGAPVCAKNFAAPIMQIYTCMRISDNLEESISSFYAELIRIKTIVTAAKTSTPIFFLLDEIFRGTNSLDRHTGAKVLINQLNACGAYGFVSTHDLELGDMEKETNANVKNYHFREYYKNNEIHFDYRLRPGVSTTRNALFLIKMAGIDIELEN